MPKKQIGRKIDEQGSLTDLGYTVTQEEINDWNNKVDKDSLNNYLPLSGATMNGDINYSNVDNRHYRHTSKLNSNGLYVEYFPDAGASPSEIYIRTYGADSIEDFQGNGLYFPRKSGTIATTDDIPTNNNQLTNGAGFINKDVNNLTNYTLAVNTASSIEMSIDDSTYVVSLKLKNAEGTQLGDTQTIDLPLESVVVNGAYDSTTKEVVLTLDNGSEIRFSVADLVSGLAKTTDLANYVPTSRTINGKPLSANVSLESKDIGALPNSTSYVSSVYYNSSNNSLSVNTVNGDNIVYSLSNGVYRISSDETTQIRPSTLLDGVHVIENNIERRFYYSNSDYLSIYGGIVLIERTNTIGIWTLLTGYSNQNIYSGTFSFTSGENGDLTTLTVGKIPQMETNFSQTGKVYINASFDGNGTYKNNIYQNTNCFMQDGKLYSEGKQVANKEDIKTKTSELENDSNFAIIEEDSTTSESIILDNYYTKDQIYPVGSIYMSVNSTSPASFLGGTWERLKDRFLLGAGDSYSAGSTGGEASHTLTIEEMPSHTHDIMNNNHQGSTHSENRDFVNQAGWGDTYRDWGNFINYTGGNQAHNNMPPYLSVYMFKRVA